VGRGGDMPKLDIIDLLNAGQSPNPADVEASLGKKSYRKYEKLKTENPSKSPAEVFMMLGEYLENNSHGSFGFGKMYPAALCYSIAAIAFSPAQALKSYAELVRLSENVLFREDLEDSRVNQIRDAAKSTITQIKATPVEIYSNLPRDMQALIDKAYTYQDKILAERLDAQYEIYLRSKAYLQTPIDKDPNSAAYIELNQKASSFMKIVLDSDNAAQIQEMMKTRQAKMQRQPEFIPNKTPILLRSNNQTEDRNDRWKQVKEYGKAVMRGTLMEVNDRAREKDQDENIMQLNAAERDEYRVHIAKGKFYTRNHDNEFQLYDTRNAVSHGHPGFAAYVINAKGELSVFSHYGLEKPFAHSSLNSQASVYAAGEIKIENGELKELTPYSGHYRPNNHQVLQALIYLKYQGIDISNAVVNLTSFDTQALNSEMKYNALDFFNNPQIANSSDMQSINRNRATSEGEESSLNVASVTSLEPDFESHGSWADFSDFDSTTPTTVEQVTGSAESPRSFSFEEDDWADFPTVTSSEAQNPLPNIYSQQNKIVLFNASKNAHTPENPDDNADIIDNKFSPKR
jgi:hypothetical protein